jgi:ubiquinone/menaquinone biosynthesis C-methylase UbiE
VRSLLRSSETAAKYIAMRNQLTSTDEIVFNVLRKIGLSGKNILDYGCGDGRYSLKLKSLGASSVIGIDNSAPMIELANKRDPVDSIRFLLAEGVDLPFNNGSFDLVFAYFVLHHIQDLKVALSETARVLKDSGSLVAAQTTFQATSDLDPKELVPIKLGKGSNSVTVNVYPKTDNELKAALRGAGFEIISYDIVSNPESVLNPLSPASSALQKQTVLFHALKN